MHKSSSGLTLGLRGSDLTQAFFRPVTNVAPPSLTKHHNKISMIDTDNVGMSITQTIVTRDHQRARPCWHQHRQALQRDAWPLARFHLPLPHQDKCLRWFPCHRRLQPLHCHHWRPPDRRWVMPQPLLEEPLPFLRHHSTSHLLLPRHHSLHHFQPVNILTYVAWKFELM